MQEARFERMQRHPSPKPEHDRLCRDIPASWDRVWFVYENANFERMVNNYPVVIDWLSAHMRRKKKHLIAPSMDVFQMQPDGPIVTRHIDQDGWMAFTRHLVTSRTIGVAPMVWRTPRMAHSIVCFVDGRRRRRVDVYFVDPNGYRAAFKAITDHGYKSVRTAMVNTLRQSLLRVSRGGEYAVRSWVLKTPPLNNIKTEAMRLRDEQLGFDVIDEDAGFCEPWTYALMLDMLCAPSQVLTVGHFKRLFDRAGGQSEDPLERDHTRLMYLRAVLSWIARLMFNPSDPNYKNTMQRWKGEHILSSCSGRLRMFAVDRGKDIE